jgi:hypothetical protein
MVVSIVLRIDEEQLQEGLEKIGRTRNEFKNKMIQCLGEDVAGTIEDNWELFDEIRYTVD